MILGVGVNVLGVLAGVGERGQGADEVLQVGKILILAHIAGHRQPAVQEMFSI